jgi:hypothetical protein
MTGKRYYITTRAAWQRHAGRFVNSHWIQLSSASGDGDAGGSSLVATEPPARILVLVEGDEGAHVSLEDDPAFEALPHPLTQKAVSDRVQETLAPLGLAANANTFDVAEAAAQVHPLLRHRIF